MSAPIFLVLGSGALLACVLVIFRVEDARGARFFGGSRSYFDAGVLSMRRYLRSAMAFAEQGFFRQTLHFFFHNVLNSVIRFLERCDRHVRRLQRSNRTIARRSREERVVRSHFDEISEHKIATALTPKERKKVKEKAIGERL